MVGMLIEFHERNLSFTESYRGDVKEYYLGLIPGLQLLSFFLSLIIIIAYLFSESILKNPEIRVMVLNSEQV